MNIKKETIEEIGYIIIKSDGFVVVLVPSVSLLIVTRRSSVCHAVVIIAVFAVVVFILKSLRPKPIVSTLSKHTKIAK